MVVHLAYLLYVLLGGFLGLRNVNWLWPHAVTAFWGVAGVATQLSCPLTLLEKHLIRVDGTEPYSGPFISHYLVDVVYPASWQPLVWYVTFVLVLTSYVVTFARRSAAKRLLTR